MNKRPQRPPRSTHILSVVLLEDDLVDAELFTRQLTKAWPAGVSVTRFDSVAKLTECNGLKGGLEGTDLVISDLTLPDGFGLEVVRAVLTRFDAPVIILTGNADQELASQALELGAQDYLCKGEFDVDDLARALRHSIARGNADAENRLITAQLTQINSELDQFAGAIAHDLRAPIRTARLFGQRLSVEAADGNDTTAMAGAMDASLERLEMLIDRLLHMASIRDRPVEPEAQLLSSAVDDVVQEMVASISEAQTQVTCSVDGVITVDPFLVRELLRNLLANSVQYRSPERGLTIDVSTRAYGSSFDVIVIDNGVGIDHRYRERAFNLFERIATDETPSSLGFGLALCRQITEMLGGTILFEDTGESFGARVRISIPTGLMPTHVTASTVSSYN